MLFALYVETNSCDRWNTYISNSIWPHYSDVIMITRAPQIHGVSSVCLTVNSGAGQSKHQSSASLAFVRGIHRWSGDSPHKGPVPRKKSIWWRHNVQGHKTMGHQQAMVLVWFCRRDIPTLTQIVKTIMQLLYYGCAPLWNEDICFTLFLQNRSIHGKPCINHIYFPSHDTLLISLFMGIS